MQKYKIYSKVKKIFCVIDKKIFVLKLNVLYLQQIVLMTFYEELFGPSKASVNSAGKGKSNEAALARFFNQWTGEEFVRIPRSGGLRWKNTQNICGDIMCTNLDFKFPFSIETKFLKTYRCPEILPNNSPLYRIWKQPLRDAMRSGRVPMLVLRKNEMPKNSWHIIVSENDININMIDADILFSGRDLYAFDSRQIIKIPFTEFKNLLYEKNPIG